MDLNAKSAISSAPLDAGLRRWVIEVIGKVDGNKKSLIAALEYSGPGQVTGYFLQKIVLFAHGDL